VCTHDCQEYSAPACPCLWSAFQDQRPATQARAPTIGCERECGRLVQGTLVHMRVMLCGWGAPDDMVFIYALQDQEAHVWAKARDRGGRPAGYEVGEEPPDATEVS
jgi:hypothetical protein